MAKEAIKKQVIETNGKNCELTGALLPDDMSLFDTHRKTPKRKGGQYTKDNTVIVLPVPHMQHHESLKQREQQLDELKSLVDERNKLMQGRIKINNQMLAYQRQTDNPTEEMTTFLSGAVHEFEKAEAKKMKSIEKQIKSMVDKYPVLSAILSVKSVGPVTAAYCMVYLDPHKARHASSFWKYVGLHTPASQRYTKGESGGGNKRLRTVLYTMADSQVKGRGPYRVIYDRVKERLSISEKMVESRNTQGKTVICKWSETKPSHRHGAALRAVMKHFLADLWFVWRTLEGLDTSPGYSEAMLGSTHKTIMPDERGWKFAIGE